MIKIVFPKITIDQWIIKQLKKKKSKFEFRAKFTCVCCERTNDFKFTTSVLPARPQKMIKCSHCNFVNITNGIKLINKIN